MKNGIALLFILICSAVSAQSHVRKVLFLGNSYTYVNNLPQLVADAATSAGDTLLFDSYTIGGYTLSEDRQEPELTSSGGPSRP